jgi:hypothetical protein
LRSARARSSPRLPFMAPAVARLATGVGGLHFAARVGAPYRRRANRGNGGEATRAGARTAGQRRQGRGRTAGAHSRARYAATRIPTTSRSARLPREGATPREGARAARMPRSAALARGGAAPTRGVARRARWSASAADFYTVCPCSNASNFKNLYKSAPSGE